MSYEPKIEVVQQDGMGGWNTLCAKHPSIERAYLVRGLPMPGEKVVTDDGLVGEVCGIEPEVRVRWDDGQENVSPLFGCRPYDPEAERLRVATEAVRKLDITDSEIQVVDIARAVLDALKEVDDG